MKQFYCFILGLISFSITHAQSSWTLQKCIEVGLQNNIAIKQAQLNVQVNHLNYQQSKENILPSLTGFTSYNFSFGRNINPVNNSYVQQNVQSSQMGLSTQVVLFSGFQNANSIKLNRINEAASRKDLEVINNSLSLQIATQFLQILFADESIKVEQSMMVATEKQLETANMLFLAGNSNQSAVLEFEAKLASNKLNLLLAQNNSRQAKTTLTQLMQIPFEETFSIESPLVAVPDEVIIESSTSIYDKASKILPEIERSNLKHKASLMNHSVAKGGYYPTLSLNANLSSLFSDNFKDLTNPQTILIPIGYVQTTNDLVLTKSQTYDGSKTRSFSNQINDNLGKSIGFSVNIPLYNNARIRTSVKQASLNCELQKLEMLKTQNELFTAVVSAMANYTGALAKYRALTVAKNAQLKNHEFNSLRYETGLISSTDLLGSQTAYETSEFNLIQGKYDLIFRKIMLDFYKGKPVTINP